jgi:NitT/TauT family transport system substrate-binding protein
LRAAGFVVAVMLIVVACGGSPSASATASTAASGSARASASPGPRTPTPTEELALTPVRVQLRWTMGAEFAGYVAAIDQGYFESEGLDVRLVEGGPDIAPEVAGSAVDGPEFTISWVPRVLAARATAATDLVDIGQIFHRSSTLTMAFREQDVSAPADFKDKRVGVLPGGDRLEVTAAAKKAGVALPGDGHVVDLGTGVDPLLTGEVDVAQVTIHDTYARALEATDRRGRPYQVTDFDVINVEDEGTAMLQDAVFARASWLAREGNEAIATAFLKAIALGWIYCRDHPSDCVDSVVAAGETIGIEPRASPSPVPPSPTGSAETRLRPGHEAWGMNEVNPLIWPSPAGIGVMVPDEWQHTVDVLLASDAIAAPPAEEAFRTDLMERALESLEGLDTKGDAFVKGTVEIEPSGG